MRVKMATRRQKTRRGINPNLPAALVMPKPEFWELVFPEVGVPEFNTDDGMHPGQEAQLFMTNALDETQHATRAAFVQQGHKLIDKEINDIVRERAGLDPLKGTLRRKAAKKA